MPVLNPAVALAVQTPSLGEPNMLQARVHFGPYELDPKAGELRSGELRTILQDQPHSILLMLIEHAGEIVTRDEIQRRLWPDVVVDFEHSINQAIRKLRSVLNDSADDPKYIETVGRRGYRLRVPVEVVEEPLEPIGMGGNHVFDHRLQRLATGEPTADGLEELQTIAAALLRLLQKTSGSRLTRIE